MGMYDVVNYECDCPVCGAKAFDFQSKDKDCLLNSVEPTDLDNFYTHCFECECWIEMDRIGENTFRRTVQIKDKLVKEHTTELTF